MLKARIMQKDAFLFIQSLGYNDKWFWVRIHNSAYPCFFEKIDDWFVSAYTTTEEAEKALSEIFNLPSLIYLSCVYYRKVIDDSECSCIATYSFEQKEDSDEVVMVEKTLF